MRALILLECLAVIALAPVLRAGERRHVDAQAY